MKCLWNSEKMGLDITARDITEEQIHPLMSEKLCNADQVSEQLLHQTHTHTIAIKTAAK